MKTSFFQRAAGFAAVAMALALSRPCLADEPPLEERVAALEREVAALRQRVAELEGRSSAPAESVSAKASPNLAEVFLDDPLGPDLREAAKRGDVVALNKLLNQAVPADARDDEGTTALHWAALQGHLAATEALLEGGAEVDGRDSRGFTPLMFASWMWPGTEENLQEVESLIAQGVTRLASQEDADLLTTLGVEQEAVAALLLDNGADIQAANRDGETALLLAADRGLGNMVRLLLDRGADPNLSDRSGDTPLIRAIRMDNMPEAEALLDRGADPSLENHQGETGFSLALHGGHYALSQRLAAQLDERRKTADPAKDGW
jgi:ankyrin repeat protein